MLGVVSSDLNKDCPSCSSNKRVLGDVFFKRANGGRFRPDQFRAHVPSHPAPPHSALPCPAFALWLGVEKGLVCAVWLVHSVGSLIGVGAF